MADTNYQEFNLAKEKKKQQHNLQNRTNSNVYHILYSEQN